MQQTMGQLPIVHAAGPDEESNEDYDSGNGFLDVDRKVRAKNNYHYCRKCGQSFMDLNEAESHRDFCT